jgi:hypothetical protein
MARGWHGRSLNHPLRVRTAHPGRVQGERHDDNGTWRWKHAGLRAHRLQVTLVTTYDLNDRAIHRRAVEAAVWGMPAVNFQLMYREFADKVGGDFNQILYWPRLLCSTRGTTRSRRTTTADGGSFPSPKKCTRTS